MLKELASSRLGTLVLPPCLESQISLCLKAFPRRDLKTATLRIHAALRSTGSTALMHQHMSKCT